MSSAAAGAVPEAISAAANGDGTAEQRKALMLDLYARLQAADPASAAAAVVAFCETPSDPLLFCLALWQFWLTV